MSGWRIEKSQVGDSWELQIGIAGTPFFRSAAGLTRKQAEDVGRIIGDIEERARKKAQADMREALGIKE